MKHSLNLAEDGRVLSASYYNEYSPADAPVVEELPGGDIYEYRYVDGEFIHDPLPEPEPVEVVSPQADTDAMIVDHEYRLTLLELGLV